MSKMPPTRKKRGRPPGSKNKKIVQDKNVKTIDYAIVRYYKSLKTEDADKSDRKFVCSFCNAVVETTDLKPHLRQCFKERNKQDPNNQRIIKVNQVIKLVQSPYCCNECTKRFRFKKSYEDHILMEHSKLPESVQCEKCPVRCPNEKVLQEHVIKFHDRDVYLCPTCKKEFVRRSHVIRHMAQSGCSGDEVLLYPCDLCDAKFTRKDNLVVHLRCQHILKKCYSCKTCEYETKNFSKLINHWVLKHSDSPKQFQCDHCSKTTSSRAAMAKHLEIHGDKKFYCDVCGYSTFTIEVMRRHVWTHVPNKPFKCDICNNSYIQRSQLERHLEKHSGIVCNICNQSFSSRSRLIIHEREHMGLDKMVCPFKDCVNKEFSNEARFDIHLKKHFEEKPHACEVCGKGFHSELNMRRHLATHTLDRPRRCMYCVAARAYVRGEQLVRHVRKNHPDVFRVHLAHVRQVLGQSAPMERVRKSELESILNVLDAEADRILQGYSGAGVLYGGMQPVEDNGASSEPSTKKESPLMSEEELAENLTKLLSKLIDSDTLQCFGWGEETVDEVLEKVVEQCGARPADRDKWTRVQCLRENAKHLFLYGIEDKTVSKMLDTHTIDQIISHILATVGDDDADNKDNDTKYNV